MHRFALKFRQIDSNDIECDNEINRSTKTYKSRNETITLNKFNRTFSIGHTKESNNLSINQMSNSSI